jgi:hypothetical protein
MAYVEAGLAFIASDTKRSRAFSPVTKSHVWSDWVLLGQSGCATYMTLAIDYMMKCRGASGDGFRSAIESFVGARATFHAQAVQALGPAGAEGTLLVACANPADGGPSIWTIALNPSTPPQLLPSNIGAIGDSAVASAASAGWSPSIRSVPAGLPTWAGSVVGSLVGPTIDWPVDVIVARNSIRPGQRVVVRQRLLNAVAGSDPAFD